MLDKFEEIKRIVERMRQSRDKAAGALEEIAKQFKEFQCKNLKEAKGRLKELEEKEREMAQLYEKELKKFLKEHKSVLDSLQ